MKNKETTIKINKLASKWTHFKNYNKTIELILLCNFLNILFIDEIDTNYFL